METKEFVRPRFPSLHCQFKSHRISPQQYPHHSFLKHLRSRVRSRGVNPSIPGVVRLFLATIVHCRRIPTLVASGHSLGAARDFLGLCRKLGYRPSSRIFRIFSLIVPYFSGLFPTLGFRGLNLDLLLSNVLPVDEGRGFSSGSSITSLPSSIRASIFLAPFSLL